MFIGTHIMKHRIELSSRAVCMRCMHGEHEIIMNETVKTKQIYMSHQSISTMLVITEVLVTFRYMCNIMNKGGW